MPRISKKEKERREILRSYRRLIEVWHTRKEIKDKWMVRKAFKVAADAHKDMRRKTGEPFIYHPLAVAIIAAEEIGLGRTSIISALLHDTVEDTDLTLQDIEVMFDADVARIIDGLTKIDEIYDTTSTAQSETLKKVLFTLIDDVRVILIKLADRLHNMRTMDIMPREKQMKIASETLYIYAPLANRLGLYAIKSELEELSFKYMQPLVYEEIRGKLDKLSEESDVFYETFCEPIKNKLQSLDYSFEIKRNRHTTYSIWKKMKKSEVSFEEINDIEGVDVIVVADKNNETLKCWGVYSVISSIYKPNAKRLRDWISTPKANGYEAIHTTVMSGSGQWVDMHIRSQRMDEIASKGYAAYWKYRGDSKVEDFGLDDWLKRTRELLRDKNDETIDFINDFKSNLFSDEIFVFTPKGEVKNLPLDATVLDFAYLIHTDLGNHCIGANINHKLVPIDYKLKSGDQITVIRSKVSQPNPDWYKYVVTARSKSRIKLAIKNKRKKYRAEGEIKLENEFKQLNLHLSKVNISILMKAQNINSLVDLYYFVATDKLQLKNIKESFPLPEGWSGWLKKNIRIPYLSPRISNIDAKETKDGLEVNEKNQKSADQLDTMDYIVEKCCNPIPGDDVIGLFFPGEPIQIHRTGCGRATQLMSYYGKDIVKTKWKQKEGITFLASLKIKAADKMGLLSVVASIASNDLKINIRNMYLRSSEGLTDISISVYVPNTQLLNKFIQRLKKIKEVIKVTRVDKIEDLI